MNSKMFLLILVLLFFPFGIQGASLDIVINEIAWMGTEDSSSDEWIELYNNTDQDINLEGWGLYEAGGETLIEPLTGIIRARSYYLIERTDDTTIPSIPASQEPSGWKGHGLKNDGEHLQLLNNNSSIIDEVNCSNGWFAGDNETKKTMERVNFLSSGNSSSNWQTSNNSGGTPKAQNSGGYQASPPPPPEPESQPEPELKPKPETQPAEKQQQEPVPSPESEIQPQKKPQPIVYPSGILINEIVPSPDGPDSENEWLELVNLNNIEVNISGWKIQDTIGSVKTYIFPEGTKIPAQGFLVLYRPTTNITLNNSGDTLKLIQPNENIIDNVSFDKAPRGQSYNRTNSEWSWSTNLTPNAPNIISTPRIAQKKTGDKKSESQTSEAPTIFKKEKELAAVGEQIPKTSKSLNTFLIALTLSLFSAIIILILKRKLTEKEF